MKKVLVLFLFLSLTMTVSAQQKKTVLIFGDSIAAGLGVEPSQAFPAIIQDKIDSAGLDYEVINAGLSGETSAGGVRRIDWVLQREIDIMILELGGNDGLRGIDLRSTKENLQKIINKVLAKNPDAEILIAGMQVPPNLGTEYTQDFQKLYPELADENDLTLIPRIMDKLGGSEDYIQSDGIHPTPEGHRLIADTVWEQLEPVL